jgi:hypothetical protein
MRSAGMTLANSGAIMPGAVVAPRRITAA